MSWLQRPIAGPFLCRMRQAEAFGALDLESLAELGGEVRTLEANTVFVHEGERGNAIHVLLDGWAARFKMLDNGSRQVSALRLAGDICSLDALYLERMDCGTASLTRCTVAAIPREELLALIDRRPGVRAAIGRMAAVENGIS